MSEWSRLKLVTAAATPPVSLDEAKRHLRVDFDEDNPVIQACLDAAVSAVSGPNGIGVALGDQTWRLSLDFFPCKIVVPLGPVTEITSITYTDENGTAQTVTDWRTDYDAQPCRIWPARDTAWPSAICEPGAVKVEFRCGFEPIPADLRAAILLLAGHLYEHREAVTADDVMELPMGVASILERYRVGRFA